MDKIYKIALMVLLFSTSVFAKSVLEDLSTNLDECKSFQEDLKDLDPLEHKLFEALKGETLKRENYIYPKKVLAGHIIRLYTLSSKLEAYKELKGLTDNYTAISNYDDIFPLTQSKEQKISFTKSLEDENYGFNCYIKADSNIWIISYPNGLNDREGKEIVTAIEDKSDGEIKMYLYKNVSR